MATGAAILGDFCPSEDPGPGPPCADRPDAEWEAEDLADAEPDDAERGVGWLRGPEEAGLDAEKGSIGGVLGELLAAEAATAENLSPRLSFTAEAAGAKEGFNPRPGVDALGIGVLSKAGLKPEDPKENAAAADTIGEAAGVGPRGA